MVDDDADSSPNLYMIAAAQISPAEEITVDGLRYTMAFDDGGRVVFIATFDPEFVTSEGLRVESTYQEVEKAARSIAVREPGWAFVVPLPSGWNAAFVREKQGAGRSLVAERKAILLLHSNSRRVGANPMSNPENKSRREFLASRPGDWLRPRWGRRLCRPRRSPPHGPSPARGSSACRRATTSSSTPIPSATFRRKATAAGRKPRWSWIFAIRPSWSCTPGTAARRAEFPGWHRCVEYIPRANAICREVFPKLLGGVRAAGVPLFHVVGGGRYYENLPGYQRAKKLAGEPPKARETIAADPTLQRLRQFRSDNVFVGKHNQADVAAGFARLDFAPEARPLGEEGVAENGEQLFALCKEAGVNHLVYAGFAINWCLLLSPGGMHEMSGRGILCSAFRDATTAVENQRERPAASGPRSWGSGGSPWRSASCLTWTSSSRRHGPSDRKRFGGGDHCLAPPHDSPSAFGCLVFLSVLFRSRKCSLWNIPGAAI